MKSHRPLVTETPEIQRSKRLSTILSSAATQSLFQQQAATSRVGAGPETTHKNAEESRSLQQETPSTCVQDTPDHENAHRIFMEKKLKYSRRKDISLNIPSEETFVQQSQGALSSTILAASPLLNKKPKDTLETKSSCANTSSLLTRRKSRDETNTNLQSYSNKAGDKNHTTTAFENNSKDPISAKNLDSTVQISTPSNNQGTLNISTSSSSRRKKGKPCKIVAWDKLESVDPLATSVFRNNLSSVANDSKNVITDTNKQSDATFTDAKSEAQEDKSEKKVKKRESISRNRRMSSLNAESFVNYILTKEKTPSPGTRLLKERIAANLCEEDSDDESLNQKSSNGSYRKSIFISGNVKSRTKQQLQIGSQSVGSRDVLDANEPQSSTTSSDESKRPKSRKNLSKELGSSSNVSVNSSLLAVPLQQETRKGRRSSNLQRTESQNGRSNRSLASRTGTEQNGGTVSVEEGSTISVSGISGLSFQNFSSDSAKAAMDRIEKEGWNSDIEKQLTGEKVNKSDATSTKQSDNDKQSTCDKISKSVNTRKSLKRKISEDAPSQTGKKGRFDKTKVEESKKIESVTKVDSDSMQLVGATPHMARKQTVKVRTEQKTSLTPEPMELCDSPARRSGRKSTQASTLASDGLLKSPALLKQSIVAAAGQQPDEPQEDKLQESKVEACGKATSSKKSKPDNEVAQFKAPENVMPSNLDEEDIPATQKPPLFENLVFFVEVLNGRYSMSSTIENRIEEYGGMFVKKISKKTTHVIFHFGTRANYLRAKKLGLPILSSSFVTESIKAGKLQPPAHHPSINIEDYDKGKFPSLRKLKSYTIRPTEERMQIIEEKFQRKKRKEERERQKEEERKKAAQRPKPVYYAPLYYEGSPYMKPEKPEDKVAKILEEIKSPTGSPLRMEYFKAPTTPIWEDENEINLSLADRLLYRYKKNKALDRANRSGSKLDSSLADDGDSTLDTSVHDETRRDTPNKKIFESSNLDTTRKPRRLHKEAETTIETVLDNTVNLPKKGRKAKSTKSNTTMQNSKKPDINSKTTDFAEPTTELQQNDRQKEDSGVEETQDDTSCSRRRSGRASTQLATKVSAILAEQETSPVKLANIVAKKVSTKSNKSVNKSVKTTLKQTTGSESKPKSVAKPSDVDKTMGDTKLEATLKEVGEPKQLASEPVTKKKRGRKAKNVDEELAKAKDGNFGRPNLESTRLSVLNSETKTRRVSSDSVESPVISKQTLKASQRSSKTKSKSESTLNTSPKTPAEIENDRIFDALLSSKFGASTSKKPSIEVSSGKKKFLLSASAKSRTKASAASSKPSPCPSPRHPSTCPSPRQVSTCPSPRASPRHAPTCPSPSASPRQESGSSPRHQQSSSPRPASKNVEWFSSRQWGGGGVVSSSSRSNPSSVLSASAASIYQSSLAKTSPMKKEEPSVENVPVTAKPATLSSPDITPTKKAKVVAPWRRNQESPAEEQNVSKDSVYDFEGFPDELDASRVLSTQCTTSLQPSTTGKMFSVSPNKPQGTFLLRSKRAAPPAGKLNLNSVLKNATSPSSVSNSKPSQVASTVAVPNTSTSTSGVSQTQVFNSWRVNSSNDVTSVGSGVGSFTNRNKVSNSSDRPDLSAWTNTFSTKGYEKPRDKMIASFELENSIKEQNNIASNGHSSSTYWHPGSADPQNNELSVDKPQRAAKKALLSRIFSKPPSSRDSEDQHSPGGKDGQKASPQKDAESDYPATPDKLEEPEPQAAVAAGNTASDHAKVSSDLAETVRIESSDNTNNKFLSQRKRKLYSQDVLDETAKNSPSSAHQGLTKPPPVENIHIEESSKHSDRKSAKSKASKTNVSEFKRPDNKSSSKTGKKKRKKARNASDEDETKEIEDTKEESSGSLTNKKGGIRASRRSSAEFAPLPRFLKRMEEKAERDSSSSSESSKRRRGVSRNIVCTSCTQEDISLVQQLVETYGKYNLSTAVNSRTSHVISGEGKRTLNLLKGLLSGCWLVTREWVVSSLEAGYWVDEEPYEMVDFSPAVRTLRMERETWRDTFKSELFKQVGAVYISPNCRAPRDELKQLVQAGGGLVTSQARIAEVIVGEPGKSGSRDVEVSHVTEKWILDSVQFHVLLPFADYPVR